MGERRGGGTGGADIVGRGDAQCEGTALHLKVTPGLAEAGPPWPAWAHGSWGLGSCVGTRAGSG